MIRKLGKNQRPFATGFDSFQFDTDKDYLHPHLSREFAPEATVKVPFGHEIQLFDIGWSWYVSRGQS